MRLKLLLITIALFVSFVSSYGQTSFLGLDGGLEGSATIDNLGTTGPATGKWTKTNASVTLVNEVSTVRSGSNSLKISQTSTTLYRVYTPQFTISASASKWYVQFYRRSTSTTNSIQQQPGNIRGGTEQSSGTYTSVSAANTWEKVTYAPTTTTSATSVSGVMLDRAIGTGGDLFIDDFVIYSDIAVDNTAANSPGAVTASNPTTSSLDISWTAASGGVDGGGYVVVRYATSPNADNDPNQNGIYAVGNTTTNGTGSLTGTVVYIGTGTSFTNSSLASGTSYYYKVYTVDKAFNYSAETSGNGTTTSAGITSAQTGNWSDTNTWVGGVVPTSADNAIIATGHTVTMDNATYSTRNAATTVNSGGTLATNLTYTNNGTTNVNGTFQINGGGYASGNAFVYAATGSTLIMNHNNSTPYDISTGQAFWPIANPPFNVTIASNSPTRINNTVGSVAGTAILNDQLVINTPNGFTVNGILILNANGYVGAGNAPVYGSSSLLVYNSGGSFNRGAEWTGASSGAGFPNNVQISNPGTICNIGGPSNAYCGGYMLIDASTTLNTDTTILNVGGSVTTNGTLNLGADIKLGGNWTVAAAGAQNNNGKAVFFNGATGNQTITKNGGGIIYFDYLILDKAAGNAIISSSPATDITINTNSGDVLQLINAGLFDLNGRTLTLNNNGGNIATNATGRTITSGILGGTITITGIKSIVGTGTLILDTNITTILTSGLDFGANKTTINGTLQLNGGGYANNNAPIYANASTLVYNTNYGVSTEWTNNGATAGQGTPQNVTIQNSAIVTMPNGNRGMAGNLSIPTGNLSLNATSGDLYIGGNIVVNSGSSFSPNNRAVFFTKNGTQTITATTTPTLTFHYVVFAPSSGSTTVLLNGTDLNITAPLTGNAIAFNNSGDVFDINGKTLTLGTTGVANAIFGSGTFKGTTTSNLTLLGTGSIGTLNFTSSFQILKNLTIDRTSNQIVCTLGTPLSINGVLSLTNGILDLVANQMIITNSGSITGASSSNYIIADFNSGVGSGILRKNFPAGTDIAGSFTFPIGDRTLSADGSQYSPATINFTNATYSSGWAALSVEDSKEPNNDAPTDFTTRYWNLTSSGITSATYDFTGTYLPVDISGIESNYKSGRLRTSNLTWFEGTNSAANTVSLTGLLSSAAALDSSGGYNFTAGNPFRKAEINIKQGVTSYATASTYTFAPALTGTNNDIVFTIENTGLENLNLAAATMTGSAYSLFVNYVSPVTGPAGTTTFTIRFAPGTAGTLIGSISIPNNDTTGSENPYVINFSGIATDPAPEINIKGIVGSNPSIFSGDVTPSSLNNTLFAAQTIGNSLTQTFRIENIGTANLDVSSITLTGATGDFSITASPSYTIPFSGTNYVDFTITFTPTTSGVKNATVSIVHNDITGSESPYTFAIRGTGDCPIATNTITPTSGPVGTEVTITSSNSTTNNLTGATATFNGVTALVTQISASQISVIVPVGATVGSLSVSNTLGCTVSNYFEVINNIIQSCEGSSPARTKLFISEVTDHGSGSHSYVEIFNATGATVNLLNYTVRIHNNGAASASSTITLPSFNLVNNSAYVIAFGNPDQNSNPGGVTPNLTSSASGINDNDNIRLYNSSGTWIDLWGDTADTSFTVALKDYTYRRKNTGITAPSTTWNPNDWISFSPVNYSNVGLYDFSVGTPPSVTLHPSYTPTCKATSLTVAGTEGYTGGNPLTYKWLFSASGDTGWTEIASDAGIYTGTATATLSISNISGVINYQYYCQIRENTNTCYTASKAVKITDGGTTTWTTPGSWTNGPPTLDKLAIIDYNYNTTTNGDLNACSLTINNGKTLTVTAEKYATIRNDLTVNLTGKLDVLDKGSLVMINDSGTVTNTGTTNIQRQTTPFEPNDYTYWSTPIVSTDIETTFTTPVSFPADWHTENSYEFIPANYMDADNDGFDDDHNDWSFVTSMNPGKGYIIMVPYKPIPSPQYTQATVVFSGKVNNGIVKNYDIGLTPPNTPGGLYDAVDDFNLVGNPYPSAISADAFINANISSNGTAYNTIEGTLYFWTHIKDLSLSNSGPDAYNYSQDDYAVYTLAGGTAAGSGGVKPLGYIASCQGFFVEAVNSGTLIFNNAMRVGLPTTANSQFYKSRSGKSKIVTKDRIWLNLENSLGMFSQQLVGYFDNTTLGFDNGYDGLLSDAGNYVNFYSFIDNDAYKIQGRSTFDENDQVRLGYFSAVAGTFNIDIDSKEGVFNNLSTPVYLEDKLLDIIYDLKQSPYTFTTEKGTFNDRFILRYTNKTLNNKDFETLENQVLVSNKNKQIKVNSKVETIEKVSVYDLLGRQLFKKEKVNSNELTIPNMVSGQQTLLVKVTLQNGQTVTKKIIF
jgi:hypothetical protein